jgi:hypothetical protein
MFPANSVTYIPGCTQLLISLSGHRSPFFRANIGHMLRESPPMPGVVLGSVLSLAEWHVGWCLQNARATLLRVLEVSIDVRNGYEHVLADLVPVWRAKRPTLSTKHDGALRNSELCVTDHAVPFSAEAF